MNKKIKLDLLEIDGNAFAIMGAFAKQAKREDWTEDKIKEVLDKAKSSDYNNLLRIIFSHCEIT